MPTVFYVFISLIIAIIIVVTIVFIRRFLQKKYTDFVLQNSLYLKQLNEINSRYEFYPYISFDQSHTYDNEKFYESISCKDYLIYQLQFIRRNLFNQINKLKVNKQLFSEYQNEIKSIAIYGQFQNSTKKFNLDKLIKIERQLIEKYIYRIPSEQFYLTVTLFCSKINGQVYRKKFERFSVGDIVELSKRLNNKNGNFYNDREIWNALCRVERGKVSNKMRFSIYQRDRYRCCNCGISERYTQLEIDHIVPVSKGGKSVYDNLQTLCHRCNVEKGDSY